VFYTLSDHRALNIAALSTAVLLSTIAYRFSQTPALGILSAAAATRPPAPIYIPTPDTDGDFVPDWKEKLLGTNTQQADSNGNGISDYADTPTKLALSVPTTSTNLDTAVKYFLSNYSTLKRSEQLSPEQSQLIGTEMLNILQGDAIETPRTLATSITSPDTSYERTLLYRKDLQKALEPITNFAEPELTLWAKVVKNKDTGALEELRTRARIYLTTAQSMEKVTVPADMLEKHRSATLAAYTYADTLSYIYSHAADPLALFGIIQRLNAAESSMATSFNTLGRTFASKYTTYEEGR
jgi:hypothetical protein